MHACDKSLGPESGGCCTVHGPSTHIHRNELRGQEAPLNAIDRIGSGVSRQLLGIFRLPVGPDPWGNSPRRVGRDLVVSKSQVPAAGFEMA